LPALADPPGIDVIVARWSRDQASLRAIRRAVFIDEQAITEPDEFDGLDSDCVHFLAINEKRDAVGTVRLEPLGKIGRLAVLKSRRKLGIGKKLLKAAVEKALETGCTQVWLHAQMHATEFYRRQGFVVVGNSFDEAGIRHIRMCLMRESE